jgi:RNA polymerase sigma factor (TIGR02999 family)
MDPSKGDVTQLLQALGEGDRRALDRLLPLVYDEMREIAARHMRRERPDHTLQPTALAHEAYLRLCQRESPQWESRAHFLGVAAQAIRRILVEHARARQRDKRGGGWVRVTLSNGPAGPQDLDFDVLALDQALERLGEEDPEDQKVVELRFFGGLSVKETAHVLGVSERTVHRRWSFAKAWLYRELKPTMRGAGE